MHLLQAMKEACSDIIDMISQGDGCQDWSSQGFLWLRPVLPMMLMSADE